MWSQDLAGFSSPASSFHGSPTLEGPGFSELIDDMFLKESPFLTDVTFRLKNGTTRTAHRLLLALASPFFKAKFCGDWSDKMDQVVEMTDIDEAIFSIVLHHIYSPTTLSLDHLEGSMLWDLYNVAEMFLLSSLSLTVKRTLECAIISVNEKKSLFLHFEKAKMFEILLDTVKQELLRYAGSHFDCIEFLNLSAETVAEILGWASLMATEGQIFSAASSWCQRNAGSASIANETFARLFKNLIQVEYLSEEELVNVVIPESHILDRGTLADWTKKVMSTRPRELFRYVNLKQKSVTIRLHWMDLGPWNLDGSSPKMFKSPIEFENTHIDGFLIFFSNQEPDQIAIQCLYAGVGDSENARFYVKYKTKGSDWIIRDQYRNISVKTSGSFLKIDDNFIKLVESKCRS